MSAAFRRAPGKSSMLKSMTGALSALMLLATAATPAAAAQDDSNDWTFTVVNISDQAVTYLYMAYQNGEYSPDLLPGVIIEAGDSVAMEFPPEDDECEYWVLATLADSSRVRSKLNLCGVEGIYVSNDSLDVY